MADRPEYATDAMLMELDRIQESGHINMFGAARELRDDYPELTKTESREVLKYWMDTYDMRHPR